MDPDASAPGFVPTSVYTCLMANQIIHSSYRLKKRAQKYAKKVKREKKKGKKIALAALESNFSDLTFCHQ